MISAQHSCVSILRCTTLKRQWLDLLRDDLKQIRKTDRRQVQEYGPVDLNNAEERVLFVKMMCRLLIYLMERSSIWKDMMKETSLEQDEDVGKKRKNKGGRSAAGAGMGQSERQKEKDQTLKVEKDKLQ